MGFFAFVVILVLAVCLFCSWWLWCWWVVRRFVGNCVMSFVVFLDLLVYVFALGIYFGYEFLVFVCFWFSFFICGYSCVCGFLGFCGCGCFCFVLFVLLV